MRLLPPEFASNPDDRAALLEQARSLSQLSHPNVTTVFEAGEHEHRVYVVFEYFKGQSLRAEMAGRAMNVRRALDLAIQMADAVAEAHGTGFIHGGLSPDSIGVTEKGHIKIPGFELAARGGFDRENARLRDYDSPEEARGQPADERSDIYSIGAVLYEMLTTRRPSHRGAAAPSAANRHIPPEVDEIVLNAVAPNPASRTPTAATFAAQLRAFVAMLEVRGGVGDEPEHFAPHEGPVGRVLATTILILAALGILVWWVMR